VGERKLSQFEATRPATERVLIDIDGTRASFALAAPGQSTSFRLVREYRTADYPTATDCVMGFARDAGINLEGLDCAVAVSGAVSGDAIRIARCPWIISATGFGYLFKKPVHFLNDSAAILWAATQVSHSTHRSLGAYSLPDFSGGGKWLGINYQSGLGAALLIGRDGADIQHVETEAGHCAFAPVGENERKLWNNLDRIRSPASWERALFAEASDPCWRDTPIASDPKLLIKQRAEMLGSFVGDTVLATGAWNGVLLFGNAVSLVSGQEQIALFDKRLESRANFQLQLRKLPRWSVTMPNINLVGAARFLENRCSAVAEMA
jgi:glucokinase